MNTAEEIRPDALARALEERGFESLWMGEHTHIPVEQRTPYPAGGELPDQYRRMMDPYVSLMLAATATAALKLGTAVALPLEHDVLALAKTVATLDRLCGGRFEFGVGVGWNVEELANHRPVPWAQRYRALNECVGALRRLWSDDHSEYHGEYYDFDPIWSLPKPLQRPHPAVHYGVGGRLGTVHTVANADGWMPMDVALGDAAGVGRKIGKFRAAASEAGRDPAVIPITLVAFGDPTAETLALYRSYDVERVVLGGSRQGWDDPSTTMPFLDRYAPLVAELR